MKKTALITGASGGLGREFARLYANDGYDLLITARNEENLIALKEEIEQQYQNRVFVFVQNLSEADASRNIYEYTQSQHLTIDVLVNNAGFADFGMFWEVDRQRQDDLLQVNIVALVELTRIFLPDMIKRNNGKVLNVASVASFCAGPKMSLYYASKAFVRSFSEALSYETKGTGVTVTALCPGPVSTGFEQAAQMTDSNMFTFMKPACAKKVAYAGYKASNKGKTLLYYGFFTKFANIATRLFPRCFARSVARKING